MRVFVSFDKPLHSQQRLGKVDAMNNDISSVSPQPARPVPVVAAPAAPMGNTREAAAQPGNPVQEAPPPVERENPQAEQVRVKQAVERLNEQVRKNSYNLNFTVDEASDRVVVSVRDVRSGEVIRQIPNEATLRMAEHLHDLKGFIKDQKI